MEDLKKEEAHWRDTRCRVPDIRAPTAQRPPKARQIRSDERYAALNPNRAGA